MVVAGMFYKDNTNLNHDACSCTCRCELNFIRWVATKLYFVVFLISGALTARGEPSVFVCRCVCFPPAAKAPEIKKTKKSKKTQ